MSSKSKPYDLCLIYKTVYERERKRNYFISGRDLKEAKVFLELNDDLDTALVETHAIQYWKNKQDFWAAKDFPAFGLWMQFNENAPKVRARVKRYCSFCCSEHYADEPHREVKHADPAQVKELLSSLTERLT